MHVHNSHPTEPYFCIAICDTIRVRLCAQSKREEERKKKTLTSYYEIETKRKWFDQNRREIGENANFNFTFLNFIERGRKKILAAPIFTICPAGQNLIDRHI